MLSAPVAVQEALNEANTIYRNMMESSAKRYAMMYDILCKLHKEGIYHREPTKLDLKYGVTIEVKEPKMWGRIHRICGKLELNDKSAVTPSSDSKKGRKVQMIKIRMMPVQKELQYNLFFEVTRKLTKNDKCKVKVVTRKSVEVVCSI